MDVVMNVDSRVVREREVEVLAKAARRRFTAEYKRRILKETDGCSKPGEIGALLRREGLYSSHLLAWRAARERGELAGLAPRREPTPTRRRTSTSPPGISTTRSGLISTSTRLLCTAGGEVNPGH